MTWWRISEKEDNPGINGGQIRNCPKTYLAIESDARVYQVSAC